ncbi:chlorophyll synthesis pathway protein BchC [Limimaricola pyoseonensis]|uniref:3-hydroxyethyl bacteriochlorophyllide a dehydrogenase n=1 Tax=Limimaricola pyoseonensis TaxID=521013 RepID=A0A1G7B1A2_9RHOB|nr:chlorophyll synthesis pathway protein BchC [Limimaricola pyoseonensis]SDE20803.1 3-hydroxyethyl bacteriochlorophyllide a dehydrogenase [Limimaricola pyoseonensis]
MHADAILFDGPGEIGVATLGLSDPAADDVVVEIRHSGISTGTERLLHDGRMPAFPGMGYPLVPGYEAVGEVVETRAATGPRVGDTVFVPGATCFEGARGLFGASARRLVVPAARVARLDAGLGRAATLMALAATARHAMAAPNARAPQLIVGHGTLGRLLARLTLAAGVAPPTVWETDPARHDGAAGYPVVAPEDDPRRDYASIYDVSGDPDLLDTLIGRLAPGGEIVLAGFYARPLGFAFPPAFLREARLRVSAEWTRPDLDAVLALVDRGALPLDGLISHHLPAARAAEAYRTAFGDPACRKMILDWKDSA